MNIRDKITNEEKQMNKIIKISIALVLAILLHINAAYAIRCGNNLVRTGDFKYEVLERCGEPNSMENVGYTLNVNGNRELKIEHWIYGPWNGFYYVLVFEGGIIDKIISRK